MRSQHEPLASAPFTVLRTSRVMRTEAQSFRLLLCRRLCFPIPLSLRTCRCGRQLDSFGHHRAACQVAGVLGRRGFPSGMCGCTGLSRSRGTSHHEHARRDMDLGHFDALDARRLEVVADGFTLWRGAQLAIDTTLVSPLKTDGTARNRTRPADARRGPTPNSRVKEVGLAWSCWQPR